MSKKISRRSFIKQSTSIGVGSVLSTAIIPEIALCKKPIDIAVVKGNNYFSNRLLRTLRRVSSSSEVRVS